MCRSNGSVGMSHHVGWEVGLGVGLAVGRLVGLNVGISVGWLVGMRVVGLEDGGDVRSQPLQFTGSRHW
jgi:hypothetical protein